ncbi:hypothetical protein [Paludisphaera soli]|uniref:hypothetical protein n=1 Tax=Paludisphaera soli TaxID=2712865 RepID=UPI0013ED96A2|nr:hypothetical protein [Paludisphaera soli]
MAERKTGSSIPAGILRPTAPLDDAAPELAAVEAGQGGDDQADGTTAEVKTPRRVRSRKAGATTEVKLEGRRIYLSEDVHFRLRMLAYQRGRKISEIAEEVLDKALPKWNVNRVG